ncbi:MAG TPA: beta-1,3-glucanase family protein [Candidatus Acidoferrales bacterium]|nr:beta-1,3-glucanase family protein [Candidatus Acidoferrales bacterium]
MPSPTGTYLVIANNTSFPNSAVYVYAIGFIPNSNPLTSAYITNNGTLVPAGNSLVPPLTLAATGDTIVPMPYITSARVWISLGAPLQLGDGMQPGFGSNTPQLYDWFELNYGQSGSGTGSLFINTTQVDMFGLPITLQINWAGGSQTVGVPNGQRAAIFAAMRADPVLTNLIVSSGGTDLRVMAINHGIDSGLVPATYLDAYIDAVWSYYTTNTLQYAQSTARVVGGNLVFTGAISTSVAQPTSSQAIGGVNAVGTVSPFLTAGLNRGTLIPATGVNNAGQQPDNTAADFYQTTPTNAYSKIFHQYNLNNLAYGFSFDDFGGFSSTVAPPTTPTSITATLSAF